MRHLPILIAAALPGFALASSPDHRPVRNSFIDRPVADAHDLVRHVRTDPVVADRYKRHFALDRAAVLRFLGTLHRGRLAQAGVYNIYSVPADGHIKMHVGRLPKGEPVFLDPRGRPTLVARCGNPIVLGSGHEVKANRRLGVAIEPTSRPDDLVAALAAEQPVALLPGVPEDALITPTADADPEVPMTETITTVAAISTSPASSGLGAAGLLLPIIGAVGLHGSLDAPHHSPQAVPEPASLIALGCGAAALARRRQRR